MADEQNIRGEPERDRINANEDRELQYWSRKWGIGIEELRRIVDQVGPMTRDVARKLGKDD